MEYIQESLFGRTSPEPSAPTKDKTSAPSSKRSATSKERDSIQFLNLQSANGGDQEASWVTATAWPGEPWTLNTGESPKDAVESTLSQILEENAPEKYSLSARACAGILRRAERRGKELPPMLREALEEVVNNDTEGC